MVEFVFGCIVGFVVAVIVTAVENLGFHEHWNFFLVWLICAAGANGIIFLEFDDGDWF